MWSQRYLDGNMANSLASSFSALMSMWISTRVRCKQQADGWRRASWYIFSPPATQQWISSASFWGTSSLARWSASRKERANRSRSDENSSGKLLDTTMHLDACDIWHWFASSSNVRRPIIRILSLVRALKDFRSSGKFQGSFPLTPITLLREMAATIPNWSIGVNWVKAAHWVYTTPHDQSADLPDHYSPCASRRRCWHWPHLFFFDWENRLGYTMAVPSQPCIALSFQNSEKNEYSDEVSTETSSTAIARRGLDESIVCVTDDFRAFSLGEGQ